MVYQRRIGKRKKEINLNYGRNKNRNNGEYRFAVKSRPRYRPANECELETMALGSLDLSGRKHPLHDCHGGQRCALQRSGTLQYRNSFLYELALSSLGSQTSLEPVC